MRPDGFTYGTARNEDELASLIATLADALMAEAPPSAEQNSRFRTMLDTTTQAYKG